MATDVIMPALGVAQEKGTLLNWLKAEGQSVTKGEPLMEVETDKATVEIEAPASGILTNVTASVGDEVPVGNRIAVILAPGEIATPAAVQDPHPPLEGEGISSALALCLQRRGNQVERNPPVPPLPKRVKGDFLASELHSMRDVYSHLPQQRESPKRKESISHPSKEAGLREQSLAEDVLRAAGTEATRSRWSRRKSKRLSSSRPMRRIVGERMTQEQTNRAAFLPEHGRRHDGGYPATQCAEGRRENTLFHRSTTLSSARAPAR